MSLEYQSTFRNRVYKRKFDHDEARKRWLKGETVADLAREYNVSYAAVARAVDWRVRVRMDATTREYMSNPENLERLNYDVCACGNRKRNISEKCRDCYLADRATQINENGDLWCYDCKNYRPSAEFPFVAASPSRNFKGGQCRGCATKARQSYRERHKLPCVGCGSPALPPNEKRTRGSGVPRCRTCFYKDQAAAREALS